MRTVMAMGWVCLLAAAAVAAEPLDETTRDFDQLHLTLRIEPDLTDRTIDGEAVLRFASLVEGLTKLRLHCEETTVLSVTALPDGGLLPFSLADGVLSIELPEPMPKDHEAEVSIRYISKPTQGFFFHLPTERHPEVPTSFYTQGQGTWNRRWIPCYDLSDDRLTVTMRLVVPDELKTVGNGLKVKENYLPGTRREDIWKLDRRIPTYLISVAAGPYETWFKERAGVLVEISAFKGRMEEAKTAFGRAGDMIEFFGGYIGTPYPYDRYAQTAVWDFVYGGMENATATTMNMRLLHSERTRPNFSADGVVAHELAHQWFGDLMTTKTGHHIWLNEGFATYFADLFFEHADGVDEFRYRRWRQTRGYLSGTPNPEKLGLTPDPRGDRPLELFGGKQYNRGAAILHQLRGEIGDEPFRRAIARYTKKHADSAVVTADFRRAVEAETGRDLGWFFDQWVHGAGYPVLAVSYEHDAGEGVLRIHLRQTQEIGGGQSLFRLTLPIRVETEGAPVRARLAVHLAEHDFEIACPRVPLHVRSDDGAWLLGRVETEQTFTAWAHQLENDAGVVARIDAIRVLERYGERGAGAIAQALLEDEFWAVRTEAARALGRVAGTGWAVDGLLNAAGDEDPRVREAVFEAMGSLTRDQAGEALLAPESHPYVIAAAARSLGKLHAGEAFETLRDLLTMDSHREVVRHGALDGLKALGDPRAIELAIPFLDYRYGRGAMSAMRHAALDLILALEPDARRTHRIVTSLLDDPYFRMRGWAADACGTYRIRAALGKLRNLAEEEPHAGPRRAAKRAVERIEGKRK